MNYNCSNFLDLRNLQEQVKKAFCYQKLFWPFTVWINCSSDLKIFENSRLSASNFKSFSRSLEQFSHSRSEQYWKQYTNNPYYLENISDSKNIAVAKNRPNFCRLAFAASKNMPIIEKKERKFFKLKAQYLFIRTVSSLLNWFQLLYWPFG